MNRVVRKGEMAIWILAPMAYKNTDAEDGEDERINRGFKFAPVFDVAQTDGEDLPSICNRLDGDDPAGHYATLLTVADAIGFSVEDHEFNGPTNGDCTHSEHRIRVETRNTPAQRVKTLVREIAHALLHEQFDSLALAELEAESTGTSSARRSGSTAATTPSAMSQPGPVAATRPSPGSRHPANASSALAATILRAFEPAAQEEAA